uniref:Phage putative head morphogenesis protein, SPP1 gp7 n=1 Tax=uncultured bacterium contig00038 TaxID=1181526 RepID=A0A806KN05_9BACT|nr:phage putative head morphogenesis protein, SPP1 gp7 [uncultured bacterium contig00038]
MFRPVGLTDEVCRALDGLTWSIPGHEPQGHDKTWPGASPHWNCRSVILPVLKSWEQLAKEAGGDSELAKKLDEIPGSTRASMNGEVAGNTTYEDWFREQSQERQLEILGPGRLYLLEEHNVPLRNMTDFSNSVLPLDELLEKHEFYVGHERFTNWYDAMEKRYAELMAEYGNLDLVRKAMPKENLAVHNLPDDIRKALRTDAESLMFSSDSMAKQLNHHPGMTAAEYHSLINKIKDCGEIYDGNRECHIVLLIERGGRSYAVTLKTTQDLEEAYVVSFFPLRAKDVDKIRKGKRIK